MKRTNYTQKSMKFLRDNGYECDVVERWLPQRGHPAGGIRKDFFGLLDIVAIKDGETVGVQSTGPSGHASHRRDMLENEYLPKLKAAGWKVWLLSWRKLLVRRGGKARRWTPRLEVM